MAQDDLDDTDDAPAAAAAAPAAGDAEAKVAKARRMTVILAAAALVIGLVGGGVGGFLASSLLAGGAEAHADPHSAGDGHAAAPALIADDKKNPSVYVPLPKMQVNLASGRCRGLFLRLEMTAEVGSEEAAAATRAAQAAIVDRLTAFIRTQTKEDLDGREGTEKFRLNVATVVNDAIQPHQARNVLFKDFLMQ